MSEFEPKEIGLERTVWLFEREILEKLENTDLKDHHAVLKLNIFSMKYELKPKFNNGRADAIVMRDTANHWLKIWLMAFATCGCEKQSEIDQLKEQLSDSDYLKVQHRERRCELAKELTRKSLRLTDAEFEYKRIKSERAKDVLTIMRQASQIDQLKADKEKFELELNQTKQVLHNAIDMELAKVEKLKSEKAGLEKEKQELQRACTSYKKQRDDNAEKLMIKSNHYNSIQVELASLKDRLEIAHHIATQSTWSALKQLRRVVKTLRGEHE